MRALKIFSYIFHPIFVPLFGTLAFLYLKDTYFLQTQMLLIIVQATIITVLLPIAFFFLLKMLGKIDSILVSEVSQRRFPLLIQSILLFVLATKSITEDLLPELHFFLIAGIVSALSALILSFIKSKASLHMMGISALTAFVCTMSYSFSLNSTGFIVALFVVNGLVGSSRLEMKAHTMWELFIGFFIGVVPQVLLWQYYIFELKN